MLRYFLAFGLFSELSTGLAQTLYINELIANNDTGQMDDFFQREDWVEIYNPGGLVNLAGYYMSDDPLNLTLWQIPNTDPTVTFMTPNSFLALWLDRDPEQGANHATFSLSADGETLFLVAPDGETIVDQVTFPAQAPDISYGRSCDGCNEWQYFNNVTFEASNAEVVPGPQVLFINEVQSQNESFLDFLNNETDPWIEIYNPNPYQVNMSGYYLGTTGNPLQWQIAYDNPQDAVIAANGFKLFWCDGDFEQGTLHAGITLNPSGGTVVLTAANGVTTTDTYAYPAIAAGQSYGRQSDGAANSIVFTAPTPRVTNSLVFISSPPLFINELLAANLTDITDEAGEHEDWIEIYNPNSFAVNLAGYYLTDNPELPTKHAIPNSFPADVTIGPNDWMLFWADENQTEGLHHTNFRLSNNLEMVGLYTPDGFTLVDAITWQGLDSDTSYGRITDGAAQWVQFTGTTPDASNNGGTVTIEEVRTVSDWSAYPNPVTNWITFSRPQAFRVYSMEGKMVMQSARVDGFDVSAWPAGVYLIRAEDGSVFRMIRE
ncbi:MAG: lamin tail domain-containing protein [Flavobacteriales bacterium]